ncbi:hypothetical protein INT47_012971 [Mucor saturninus]|uniref:Uncharacterized protein n=1 Tax=Mucor saturninus TaxID=64648 RepID=A0A8H7QV59_9FUNG|nr:hypothetical protein INT47_012971 [Mucor saturninus]
MTNKPAAIIPTDALNQFENVFRVWNCKSLLEIDWSRMLTLCNSPDVDQWRRGKKLKGPEVTRTTFEELFLETYDVKLVDKFTHALTELCCIRMLQGECFRVFRVRMEANQDEGPEVVMYFLNALTVGLQEWVRPLLAGASEEDRSSLDYIYGLSVRVTQCGADDPLLDDRVSLKTIIPSNVLQYFEEHHNYFTLEVKYTKSKSRYVTMGSSEGQLGNNKRREVNPSSATSIDVNKKRRYNGPVSQGGSTTSGNNQNVRKFSGSRGNQGVRRLGPTSSMNTNSNGSQGANDDWRNHRVAAIISEEVRSARNIARNTARMLERRAKAAAKVSQVEANKNARKSRRREARAAKKAEGVTVAGFASIGMDAVASSPPPVISEDVVNAVDVANAVDEDMVMNEALSGLEGESQESPLLDDSNFDKFLVFPPP